jgi:hypothetical protein
LLGDVFSILTDAPQPQEPTTRPIQARRQDSAVISACLDFMNTAKMKRALSIVEQIVHMHGEAVAKVSPHLLACLKAQVVENDSYDEIMVKCNDNDTRDDERDRRTTLMRLGGTHAAGHSDNGSVSMNMAEDLLYWDTDDTDDDEGKGRDPNDRKENRCHGTEEDEHDEGPPPPKIIPLEDREPTGELRHSATTLALVSPLSGIKSKKPTQTKNLFATLNWRSSQSQTQHPSKPDTLRMCSSSGGAGTPSSLTAVSSCASLSSRSSLLIEPGDDHEHNPLKKQKQEHGRIVDDGDDHNE